MSIAAAPDPFDDDDPGPVAGTPPAGDALTGETAVPGPPPPRRRRPASPGPDKPPSGHGGSRSGAGAKARKNLEGRLTETIATLGMTIAVAGMARGSDAIMADGQAVIAGAPGLAAALDKLAAENSAVNDALQKMLAASVWGGVITAVAAIALPIAANHNLIPAGIADALTSDAPAGGV